MRLPVGCETDIKPMFREFDRKAMLFALDLWSYDDVKANAAEILVRVEDGSMSCDEPWGPEKLKLLQEWVDAGCPP
jgi:hypothetical protein